MNVHHSLSVSLETVPETMLELASDSLVNKRDLVPASQTHGKKNSYSLLKLRSK